MRAKGLETNRGADHGAFDITTCSSLSELSAQARCLKPASHSSVVTVSMQAQFARVKVTAVGFEPTPFRNGALSHRLRPLGQTVHVHQEVFLSQLKQGRIILALEPAASNSINHSSSVSIPRIIFQHCFFEICLISEC